MLAVRQFRMLALGLALTGAAGTAAWAQPPTAPPKPGAASPDASARPDFEEARRHYQAAEDASARGDHAAAAREYGIAYDITRDPVMFFKIGQSYDKAGDCRSARVYYGRYVKEGNPSPDHRARAEALGEACVSKPGAEATGRKPARPTPIAPTPPVSAPTTAPTTTTGAPATEPSAPAPTPPAPSAAVTPEPGAAASVPLDQETSWQRTAAWTSVGVALALGTTAAVLGLSAASREEDIRNLIEFRDFEGEPTVYTGPARDRYVDLVDEGKRLETLSIVALAATGAAAASAAIFFVLDARADDDDGTGLVPTVGAGQAGIGWTGRF